MYEIYQGISHPGCIPAYPGYGYMNRDLYQTITSSHLVLHTKPGRIKNFKLSGVTRQVETTGAQLFDASKLLTHSQGGATVTNNGDGSFTVSGNGTLTSGFSHAIYLENEEVRRLFRPGEIYMAESPTATRPYFEVGFFKNDQNVCDIRPVSAFLKATLPDDFFAPENNLRVRYIFYGASGLDIIPGTIKPMLYQDGDGTWEPYTGTQPSPSPEYPQDIQGVGVRTKNLLDEKRMLDFILQKPGASIVQFDGRRCLKLDGAFNFPDFNLYEGFEPDKRYTLTFDGFYEKYKTEAFLGNGFAFTLQNGKRNLSLLDVSDIGTWKHKTTTSDTGVTKLTFTYGVSSVVYIDLDTIQLEEGTISTPYEPYGYRTDVVCRTEDDTESYTAPIYTREPVFQGDKIEYRNGEYGLARKNGLLTDNGTMAWTKYTGGGSLGVNRCFRISVPDMINYPDSVVAANAKLDLLCNRLPSGVFVGRDKPVSVGYSEGQRIYIRLDDEKYADIDTVDQFKAWLAEHPVEILYPLDQEVWDPLPAISQQALRNLPTYKGATMIGTTDPLEPEITVSYIPQKKNFFNPEKVFNSPVEATGYYKFDLGLSPGNYRWSIQKNEFLGSGQSVLITDALDYYGSNYVEGKTYNWVGHDTLTKFCFTSGIFTVKDVMYIASAFKTDMEAVKQLLKTLIIEKV